MKVLLWIGGVAVFGLFALFVIGNNLPPEPPITERIAKSCQEQFGDRGSFAVDECRLKLSVETLAQREADKLDAARRGAR